MPIIGMPPTPAMYAAAKATFFRELAIATTLAAAGGYWWTTVHKSEMRKISDMYAALDAKRTAYATAQDAAYAAKHGAAAHK
jgi:hypothetical protein